MITWLDIGDSFAHGLNDPGTLVTKDYGESTLGVLPGQRVSIYDHVKFIRIHSEL